MDLKHSVVHFWLKCGDPRDKLRDLTHARTHTHNTHTGNGYIRRPKLASGKNAIRRIGTFSVGHQSKYGI